MEILSRAQRLGATVEMAVEAFRYLLVQAVGSQAIPGYVGNEDEIVAGLTKTGRSTGS